MIVFWLAAALLAIVALAAIAWPIVSGGAGSAAAPQTGTAVARRARFAALLALGAAPIAAVLVYLNIGAPRAFAPEMRAASAAAREAAAASNRRIAALEEQVSQSPDDFGAWMALGEEYVLAGRAAEAARAFSQAAALDAASAEAMSAYGEALTRQAGGTVTGEARAAFEKAIALDADDPRARYYLAEARYQLGEAEEAARDWAALLNDAPPGAPWFAAVAQKMNEAAAEAGLSLSALGLDETAAQRMAALQAPRAPAPPDLDAILARIEDGSAGFEDWMNAAAIYAGKGETKQARELLERAKARYQDAPFVRGEIEKAISRLEAGEALAAPGGEQRDVARGPSEDQIAALQAMPEEERRQMIENMVESLAQRLSRAPDDPQGWRMLARSYQVLNRPQDSERAWRELLAREAGKAEDWRGLVLAMLAQRAEGDHSVSGELEAALRRLREFNADDPLALYFLGYAAFNDGDRKQARALWTRLRDGLPAESPLAPQLDALIAKTGAE